MKQIRIVMCLFFALVAKNIFATGQFKDELIVNGETAIIFDIPLEKYFSKKGQRTIDGIELRAPHTALYRGYIATWELENDSLFLIRVSADSITEINVINEFGAGKIFAEWVSDTIVSPRGEILVWQIHEPFYECEKHYIIEKGKLIETKNKENIVEHEVNLEELIVTSQVVWSPTTWTRDTVKIKKLHIHKFRMYRYKTKYTVTENKGKIEIITSETQWDSKAKEYSFFNYIYENIKYPVIATENGLLGRVLARFTIDWEKNIRDIEILRSPDELFTREVLSLIRSAPKLDIEQYLSDEWPYGQLPSKNYIYQFLLPIRFEYINN